MCNFRQYTVLVRDIACFVEMLMLLEISLVWIIENVENIKT